MQITNRSVTIPIVGGRPRRYVEVAFRISAKVAGRIICGVRRLRFPSMFSGDRCHHAFESIALYLLPSIRLTESAIRSKKRVPASLRQCYYSQLL